MADTLINILQQAITIQKQGSKVMGCLVVMTRGSTPQSPGAFMVVDDAANVYGTIGGGCIEAEVRRRVMQMIQDGESGLLQFRLDHDYGWDDGLLCGGTITIAVAAMLNEQEVSKILGSIQQRELVTIPWQVSTQAGLVRFDWHIHPRERLYIAGAGHVGQAVAQLGVMLEFDVTLFDDREDMLRRFAPSGTDIVSGSIKEMLENSVVDDQTYIVIVTRGHRHDAQALSVVVNRGAGYVGMIGSRRKVIRVFDELIARGIDEKTLADVHAPIGLDINAVTVPEIAVSIAAELIKVRRTQDHPSVNGPFSSAGERLDIERVALVVGEEDKGG